MSLRSWVIPILLTFFCFGCVSKFEPAKPLELKFEKTPPYSIQEAIEKIPKPNSINPKFVTVSKNNVITYTSPNSATNILLDFQDYKNIAALLELTKTYKTIALQQESLVNIYINTVNAYKEYLELERAKSIEYMNLWVDSENRYREERRDHQIDNIINRGIALILFATNIATLAIFAL